jgi:hypothetical protein
LQLSGHKFILDPINFVFGMGMFVLLFISEVLKEKGTDVREFFISRPRFVRWAGYYVMILLVFYFSGREDTFVYLQF